MCGCVLGCALGLCLVAHCLERLSDVLEAGFGTPSVAGLCRQAYRVVACGSVTSDYGRRPSN